MHQLSKNIEKLILQLAGLLPQVTINSHEKHWVMGSEILSWNTVTEVEGKPINPDKKYLWRYPVISSANHYRRLKNRYKKKGIEGVQEYLEWINGLAKGHKVKKQMQALMTVIKTIAENQ
jgi:hypothetical protein